MFFSLLFGRLGDYTNLDLGGFEKGICIDPRIYRRFVEIFGYWDLVLDVRKTTPAYKKKSLDRTGYSTCIGGRFTDEQICIHS